MSGWFVGGLFQRLGDLGLRCASGETLAGRCAGGLGWCGQAGPAGLRRLVRLGCGGWCGWAAAAGAARLVRLEREAGAIGEMGGALVTQTR
ncbi:hypothetical protein ACEWFU_06275 [Bifidobacterium hominis]|uniref:hypothetical protein n=1 Tax=Bifidobacterium hominis TaxID=3133177 RepID=UPI003D04FB33